MPKFSVAFHTWGVDFVNPSCLFSWPGVNLYFGIFVYFCQIASETVPVHEKLHKVRITYCILLVLNITWHSTFTVIVLICCTYFACPMSLVVFSTRQRCFPVPSPRTWSSGTWWESRASRDCVDMWTRWPRCSSGRHGAGGCCGGGLVETVKQYGTRSEKFGKLYDVIW
jgi:hypothetical protein